jgi:diketogulonate reductase-like aldo/keto reductase
MSLIDTAEIYASGGAEEVTGEAIAGRRDKVFVVGKVHETNASREGTVRAAEASLKRMRTEWMDLYLVHNRGGPHPHEETLEALHRLKKAGKIRHFGLSNFDQPDMERSEAVPHGSEVAVNQLRYSLMHRALDNALRGWHAERNIAVMAYTPLEEGFLKPRPGLAAVARRHDVSPMCIALAWTLRDPNVVSIPKASNPAHVRDNARAVDITLSAEDLDALDRDYPRPPPGTFDIWNA